MKSMCTTTGNHYLFGGLLILACAATGMQAADPRPAAAVPHVPSLDEMAGDWIPMRDVANPPAVHNFNQMLVVDRDLTSFFCHPGDHGGSTDQTFLGIRTSQLS